MIVAMSAKRGRHAKVYTAGMTLELTPTPDLLAEVSAIVRDRVARGRAAPDGAAPGGRNGRPVLVGFAAETGSLARAEEKLASKGVDLLVANDVSEPGSGFGTETNRVTILDAAGGREAFPLMTQREIADVLLDRVAAALDGLGGGAQTVGMHEGRGE